MATRYSTARELRALEREREKMRAVKSDPYTFGSIQDKREFYKREGQIRIFDLGTKKLVRELPSRGMFQQMFWSPDGQRLCGTANLSGQNWNIVSLDLATRQTTLLTCSLNCTPDWFQGDPRRVVYSCRMPGLATEYGWTMLMQATADGKSRTLICGERGRHLYYGCTSPE